MKNNLIENKILNYNSFNYESEKVNFSDYVNDKHNIIHKKLYDEALKEMIADKGYNVNNYNFIEIKQENYYEPSLVYVKSIYPPFSTEKISLKPYWNKYEYVEEHKNLDDMFLSDDINKDSLEIISINYVNNTVKYKDKLTGKIFTKSFKYVNEDSKYNLDELSLKNTFSYKLNNKIYGK
jgi:hypothetical protein